MCWCSAHQKVAVTCLHAPARFRSVTHRCVCCSLTVHWTTMPDSHTICNYSSSAAKHALMKGKRLVMAAHSGTSSLPHPSKLLIHPSIPCCQVQTLLFPWQPMTSWPIGAVVPSVRGLVAPFAHPVHLRPTRSGSLLFLRPAGLAALVHTTGARPVAHKGVSL